MTQTASNSSILVEFKGSRILMTNDNSPHLKVITALLIGHPMTKEVAGSRVTSDTSEIHVETQTSERGTCNHERLR